MMNFNASNKYCVIFTTAENETSKEGHTCSVAFFGDFVEWSIIFDVVTRFWSRVAVRYLSAHAPVYAQPVPISLVR